MKIIVEKETNIVKYAGDEYEIDSGNIKVSQAGQLKFIIGDMNSSNATCVEVDDIPNDFFGEKYLFQNNNFVINPKYTEINPG